MIDIILIVLFIWLVIYAWNGRHSERPQNSSDARISELEAELKTCNQKLKELGEEYNTKQVEWIDDMLTVMEESLKWKTIAESNGFERNDSRNTENSETDNNGKYNKLRAVVIKALHPDHAGGSAMERAAKGELFKVIWPEIEKIDSISKR